GVNGNTAADFVPAWRHMVDVARAEGATNVRWVWCPNVAASSRFTPFSQVYPGDGYVDWVCLDGYNWGTSGNNSAWRSFATTFGDSINALSSLTDKPMMIGETGSSELGGDKATWIATAYARLLSDFGQVRAVTWFDANKETDWRVDSSSSSLAAYRSVAASDSFSSTLP
ncbi:MAG: glycosyl hydrolase, partial [Candidatus Limnocylindrales bacterium]